MTRPHPVRRRALVAVATMVAVGLALVPAVAAEAGGTNWWYEKYNVAGAQSAGWDGSGVKIAVIDGQINTSLPVFQGADITTHAVCDAPADTTTVAQNSVHGTDVTALLVGNGSGPGAVRGIAPKAHVNFYADAGTDGGSIGCTRTVDGVLYSEFGLAIRQALADGNRIISISQSSGSIDGDDTGGTDGDFAVIAEAIARGVVLVVSNPNHAAQSSEQFPGASNGIVSVSAFQEDGSLQAEPDGSHLIWPTTSVVAAGVKFPTQSDYTTGAWGENSVSITGASLATPLVAGMVALTAQKYPKATGNQLIQSLIRNTGADDHALAYTDDGYGYGPASLTHLLKVDPTQYPDTNPLMDKKGFGKPTKADVAKAAQSAGGGTDTGGSGGGGGSSAGAVMPFLVIGGVIVLLLIVGVIVMVVVLTRRGRAMAGGAR